MVNQLDRMVNETSKLIRLHKQQDVDTQKINQNMLVNVKQAYVKKGK